MATLPIYDSAAGRSPLLEELSALIRYRDLVYQLIARSVKTRYKRSVIGVAWTMLNPLLTMVVLTFVFSNLFADLSGTYALFVLSGLLVWNFFAQSTTAAIGDLLWSGGLLGRVYIPKSVFAVAAIGTALVNLALALIPFTLIAAVLRAPLPPEAVLLPLPVLWLALLSLGVGLGLSSAAIYFPDVMPTYEVLLTAWMYLTPVIYPLEILPPGVQAVLRLNPLYLPLQVLRDLLLEGALPSLETVVMGSLLSAAVVLLGWWIFARRAREYAYHV